MQNWKWDWQHIVLLIAYVVGVVWGGITVYPALKGENGTQLAATFGLLAVTAITAFFKAPPKDLGEAVQDGENAVVDQVKVGPAEPPPPPVRADEKEKN